MKIQLCILFFACMQHAICVVVKLGSYNIDTSKITVSGISSGAAMANQLHVAFSDIINGAGIVAGPSYYCAEGSTIRGINPCMTGLYGFILTSTATLKAESYFSKGLIDNLNNLKDDKVYIYHGTMDFVVSGLSVKKNEDFYERYLANPASQIKTVYSIISNHGFITNNYGSSCAILNAHSFLNNCGYNQAYEILKHMYGSSIQEPAKGSKQSQSLIEFNQSEFFPSGLSSSTVLMDKTAYVYVPKQCGTKVCKLHIALHGCGQGKYKIGDEFAKFAGYNQVADLNDIIILYPQADSSLLSNPNGCWDWWGFTNSNYATKTGPQMSAIRSMINRIIGN